MNRRHATKIVRKRQHRSQPGAPPGTLVAHHEGETTIEVFAYGKDKIENRTDIELSKLQDEFLDFETVWVNVIGLADVELIKQFGKRFGIHQLTLEDVLNVHQRAKYENFESYEYFVTRMARFQDQENARTIETEQLSIIRIEKFVFSFQQVEVDCLDPVRRRLQERSGLIRERKADYLVYALIDSVIDHYFPILDRLSDQVASFDDALLTDDPALMPKNIHHVRRQLLFLARVVRPHREMLGRILRDPSNFGDSTRVFLNDCFDHTLQLSEAIDLNREISSDLRSYHLALTGNRTNEVMKTLTIVSTIFIPLSFIAGLYGMNFEHMPELKWKLGYPAAIGGMCFVALSFLFWFHRRGWFKD